MWLTVIDLSLIPVQSLKPESGVKGVDFGQSAARHLVFYV